MSKQNKTRRKVTKKKADKGKLLKWIGIGLILIATSAAALVASDKNSKTEHDLSVIGNGTATVVQIHDPGCQLCNRLKRIVGNTKDEFKDQVQFRTANIKTEKGKQFARKYGVPHVTLLFFDGKGQHVNTTQGVISKQEARDALVELTR